MSHTYSAPLAHIVFSTKDRYPFLTAEHRDRIWSYIGGMLRNSGANPLTIGGVEDHIHLLTQTPPRLAISRLLCTLKTNSSTWIQELDLPFAEKFGWQVGYAAFSVGARDVKKVARYIENQRKHHERQSFQDELRDMLRAAGIQYDERYLWD